MGDGQPPPAYVTPSGSPPANAPATSFARAIPYSTPQVQLTLTVLPWPSGIVFPALPLDWKDHTGQPVTVRPTETTTWNNENIVANLDGVNVQIGMTGHNLAVEGKQVDITSATPQETSASVSQPTAPATTTPVSPGQSPTSTTASASTPKAGESSGISNGAAAGIAVGCLVAGALIAGLVLWLCFGRRRKANVRDSEASTVALMHREKGPAAKAVSLESGSPIASGVENGLPQPLEDKAISGEISKISNLIKNHVQSFYHTGRISPGVLDFDDIQALGHDLPVSTGTLSTLLGNSATREIALRFCIAWVAASRMKPQNELNMTFLPPEVAKCFQSMSFVDRGSRVHALFMAKWRAITAELLQSSYVRNPFSPSDARNQSVETATNILDNILHPFADSRMDNQQRRRNLEEILKRSALFAFTLFSQPSSWDFDWQEEQGVKSGSLCIFPALVQVTDENGEPVKPPRPFSEAVARRLDE